MPRADSKKYDVDHRKFNVVIGKKQIYHSFKESVRKEEYTDEELIQVFRVMFTVLKQHDIMNSLELFGIIKSTVEKSYAERKRKFNRM